MQQSFFTVADASLELSATERRIRVMLPAEEQVVQREAA